ncbi:MAG: flagellar basal-body MS-ring/collar protein FliF [bacterium]|nr:flagellar basal-body MS-ring/collar protein FliF [bacterium]
MNPSLKVNSARIKELFERLSSTQKVSLISVTMVTVIAIAFLLIWANRPQYTILFTDLSPTDASRIRDQLQDGKIAYKLQNGGTTILVSKDRVYDLRLQMAAEGIPSQAGVGYEIFDRANLGMSDFVQKLNYRRALEGELGRTVSSLAEVEDARVHVVLPEPSLFKQDQKKTTASVVLKFKGRSHLNEEQIRGISTLVARSVEGLEPENVTILDSFGNLLSGGNVADPLVGLSSTQMELSSKMEASLAAKAQSMLDGVLGPGRSIVRLSADLDFTSLDRTSEIFDPESQVVRSEERSQSTGGAVDGGPSKEENSLSNYEINKTVEHLVDAGGSIKRLSVAVMVDGTYKQGSGGALEYTPRSSDEMSSLANMVRGALGLRDERGDNLQITNIAFDKESFTDTNETWKAEERKDLIVTLLPKIIMGIVLLMLIFMLRGFLKSNLKSTGTILAQEGLMLAPATGGPPQLLPGQMQMQMQPKKALPKVNYQLPDMEDELSQEVMEGKAKKEQIADFTKNKPEVATMLLRSWLMEG